MCNQSHGLGKIQLELEERLNSSKLALLRDELKLQRRRFRWDGIDRRTGFKHIEKEGAADLIEYFHHNNLCRGS